MEWRQIPGFTAYEASGVGEIRRRVRVGKHAVGKAIKPWVNPDSGYHEINLTNDAGRRVHTSVHRTIALAFLGEPPTPDHDAAHWDGNASNNQYTNLRWATSQENNADMVRHGSLRHGERHHSARLTLAKVREIRSRFSGLLGQQAMLAREYGISRAAMQKVLSHRSWRDPKDAPR